MSWLLPWGYFSARPHYISSSRRSRSCEGTQAEIAMSWDSDAVVHAMLLQAVLGRCCHKFMLQQPPFHTPVDNCNPLPIGSSASLCRLPDGGSFRILTRTPCRFCLPCAEYIGEFEVVDDKRGGKIVVELKGRLNKCGVISPRFDIPLVDMEKWTNNLLPSRQFGFLVLTTSYGIMDHKEALRKGTGGKILGFFY